MSESDITVDALVVGAGVGGIYSVWKLRQSGFSVRLFEGSSNFGGTWNHNAYPGARVDSEFPFYQLSIPEVYKTWNFSERFPGYKELRSYFEHVDKVLDIRKDTTFNAEVIEARFDDASSTWTVKTKQNHTAKCKYLILCTGSTYKRYYPEFPNMSSFKGDIHHSGLWPSDGLDLTGKKVGIIGQGATGVQVVQELSKVAGQTTVFLRTPNTAFPMKQRKLTVEEQNSWRPRYSIILRDTARKSYGGFPFDPPTSASYADATPEEREELYERLYNQGGFAFVGAIWPDYMFNPAANRAAYDFWARKTRERISDPVKKDLLAPLDPIHPLVGKRPSLEQDYYECLDKDNVKVVDLNTSPIETFTSKGINTGGKQAEEHSFDAIVLATGFDNYTGAFSTMGIKDTNGVELKDRWRDGVRTYLGLTCTGFPNMWMVYGPQGKSADEPISIFDKILIM